MSDDLVARLRERADDSLAGNLASTAALLREAAERIERDQRELDRFMPNEFAYTLGNLAREVAALRPDKAGDEIDRGLILRRRLEEEGFGLVRLARAMPPK